METKQVQKPLLGGKLSDESFITLFMVGVLIVVFGLACLVVPNFYQPQNMLNLITNNWFVIILGIGVTFLLITGNFDMSVGGNIALTGVLSVYFCQGVNVSQNALANGLGLPYVVAVGLALLCAMGVGAVNAFFIARLKVPSIIVTLGTMMLARGAAQVITQGAQRNTSLPDVFGVLGNLGIPGTSIRTSGADHDRPDHRRLHLREEDGVREAYLPHRRESRGSPALRHQRGQVSHRALHPQRPAGRHHGDPPGLRVQGRGVRAGRRGTSSTRWSSLSWEASASRAGLDLCWGCSWAPSSFPS